MSASASANTTTTTNNTTSVPLETKEVVDVSVNSSSEKQHDVEKTTKYLLENFEWICREKSDIEVIERRMPISLSDDSEPVNVFYRHFKQKNPRGAIILFHGFGSSSVMYGPLANKLRKNPLNLDVFAFDQFAHGRTSKAWKASSDYYDIFQDNSKNDKKLSNGPDCYIPSFHHLVKIGWNFVNGVVSHFQKDRLDGKPIFLQGHSMGGATVISMMMNPPKNAKIVQRISGLILEAPAINIVGSPPNLMIGLLKGISVLLPTIAAPSDASFDNDCRIPKMIEIRSTHPDCFRTLAMPLATARELLSMFSITKKQLEETPLNIPMLLLHGTADKVIDISGSELIFTQNKHEDKIFKKYDGAYHCLLVDQCAVEVHNDIYQWLLKRVP